MLLQPLLADLKYKPQKMKQIFTLVKKSTILSLILLMALTFQVQAQSSSNKVSFLSLPNTNPLGNAIELNWVTSQDVNNSYFEIERSFTGITFLFVGLALDGFENGTKKEYAFKDNSPSIKGKEVIYYRLKQLENDGKFSYSSIHVVHQESKSISDIQGTSHSLMVRK